MFTIIIPTHNRREILRKAIAGYQAQSALEKISELIVVDDGSTDSTSSVVAELSARSRVPIQYLRQENRGPAAARNAGIRAAAGAQILFTDDDIIPGPDLVAEHARWHSKFPDKETAVLGRVTWSPNLRLTPFMRWYGLEALFAYAEIEGKTEVTYRHFYTCNISLKSDFLRRNGGFDEDFKVAAWEDIELGFRLSKAGMSLMYNTAAIAYHEQMTSFRDACIRYRKSLAAAEIFKQTDAGRQCPQLTKGPSEVRQRYKKYLAPILSPFKALMDWRVPLPWSVYRTMFRIYR